VAVAIFDYESQLRYNLCLFSQMILETSRLILRSFQDEDIGRLTDLMVNRDFMRFSLGPYTREQTQGVLQKFLSWNQAGLPSQFAVIFRGSNELIGYCGFLHWHLDGADEVEIGYRLHPDYWNRGLATEAARAVREHAFRDLSLPKVISLIHPDNIASRRVAEKNGLKIARQTVFRGFTTEVFAITREEWLAERDAG
jgi:ribosomal-protein-alanine N-acetyltransferase